MERGFGHLAAGVSHRSLRLGGFVAKIDQRGDDILIGGWDPFRQLGGKLVGPWVQHFSPDGSMLATSGNDGTSRLWDVAEARLIAQTTEARAFVWGHDSERLAFAIMVGGQHHGDRCLLAVRGVPQGNHKGLV